MNILLRADLKRLFKGKALYILMGVAAFFATFSTLVIALVVNVFQGIEGSEQIKQLLAPLPLYVSSFSVLNNIGLALLITVTIIAVGDFSHATIRNKLIAGHKREHIFFSSLISNLLFMLLVLIVYSGLTYVFASAVTSFTLDSFLDVLRYALIGFSGYLVLYTLLTVTMFKFKNAWAPLLFIIGGVILLSLITFIVGIILNALNVTLNLLPYFIPIAVLSDINFLVASKGLDHFYIFTLVNILYVTLLVILGRSVAIKTDFK
ncbi:MAG: hypothetical protein RBS24_02380 [Bacilli bacterium]|nr:hypothetical protein [Bacilli bacterium]